MVKYIRSSYVHVKKIVSRFISCFIVLCVLFFMIRCAEMIYDRLLHGHLTAWWEVLLTGIIKDLTFLMTIGGWAFLIYFLLSLASEKLARAVFIVIAVTLCLVHLVLSQYFLTTLTALGADLWHYSPRDIWQIIAAAGIKWSVILVVVLIMLIATWSLARLPRRIKMAPTAALALIVLFVICEDFNLAAKANIWRNDSSEYGNSLSINKSYYFFKESIDYFFPPPAEVSIYADTFLDYKNDASIRFRYPDEVNYPFLHQDETPDVLSPFFSKGEHRPNVVIVIVEGLGRAYANEGAYLGSFTPFLDSLAGHSLYWQNFLSQAGRTFASLPSILASLPFGKSGFTELPHMPEHLSLLSLLKYNGYKTGFYYGGDAVFDNMSGFLQQNAIDQIHDIQSFPADYTKLPENDQGFCWGYGDQELMRYYNATLANTDTPYCNVLLTVASHEPFLVNRQEFYLARFEQRMKELHFDEERKADARDYKMQYASILYVDDALRQLFHRYMQRPEFNNTIFIITGDHRMPEIPMRDKLDRYRVPMILYSPLLSRAAKFNGVSTHFDITPSMLQLLKRQYQVKMPSLAAWVGSGLDTSYIFENRHGYPLMQTKHYMIDFIQGNHMLIGNDLYEVSNDLALTAVNDKEKLAQLRHGFERFRRKNRQMITGAKLLPDSVYMHYFPR
ncbi:sulfatase-like hydrolase/transferase [Chitinophaga agrisoli]|uniref:Sulfatase-like hydrolase/transferase n=2 Tax=Chitinophaga agrisoli TaxID=2607653 RepID=A0A5B2VJR2_9BACT|nr:sulfatase-like hydrolase/transferase [Chitinophaga agrisoli]